MTSRRFSRTTVAVAVISFAAAALLGLTHLHFPFMGDQALFSVYGRMLDDGATLYEDIWDVKQPGVFVFYQLAGRLFGFTEVGVHALELIYFLSFSLILMYLLRHRFTRQWIVGLIPLAIVGWYYGAAQLNYLTQLEALVGPLLFGTAWLAMQGGRTRYFWAGVLGGLVLFFKLALAPLVAVLWIVALAGSAKFFKRTKEALPWLCLGLAVVAIPWIAYYASRGLLDRVWWTYVSYPPQIPAIAGRTLRRLVESLWEFGLLYLPLFLLGLRGIWQKRHDPLSRVSAAWIIAGFATFLFQLWWSYLLLVMIIPLALLALDGIDGLLAERPRRWQAEIALAVVALLPVGAAIGIKTLDLGQNGFGIGDRLVDYQEAVSPDYADIRNDLSELPLTLSNPVYILGNPLYMFLGEMNQAPSNTGWSPEFWTQDLWDEFRDGLTTDRPEMLLVDQFSADVAAERSPDTFSHINSQYDVLAPSARSGTWYILSDAANDL
ncbi:MAG: hypothetical protein QNJ77_06275 [Acidimicrobiia bacterium]|nr:hypothetical protein [Acidimicrobiia bacterium]